MATPAQTAAQQAALAKATIAKLNTQLKTTQANLAATTAANPKPVAIGDRAMDAKAATAAAPAQANSTPAPAQDTYYTKVISGGKTQAQLDAAANATQTATDINAMGISGLTSTVDATTGMVKTVTPPAVVKKKPVFGDPDYVLQPGDPGYKPPVVSDVPLTAAELAAQAAALAAARTAELANTDAFAGLSDLFASYGLGDLSGDITMLMKKGKTANEALVMLKYDPLFNQAYTARFAGNKTRIANGLNALSEANYIQNENAYAETLKAYGLGNMLSTDRKVNEAKFAQYIANDMSPTEFNDRIKTASDNVINTDPQVMATFKQYYGGLTNSDLVAYFLAPDETLPLLKQKANAAQIGTAAQEQGFMNAAGGSNVSQERAMQLSLMGVNQPGGVGAASGYQSVAEVLPAGQKLSSIYKEAGINYDQTAAENEFLLQNAAAQKQRKGLASLERGSFSGDYGTSSQAGSLSNTRQGQF